MIAPTTNCFAKNKPIVITKYKKSGGEAKILGVLCVRYGSVEEKVDQIGNIYIYNIECTGPGDIPCRRQGNVSTINVNHGTVNASVFDNYESIMLDEIDKAILEDGNYAGTTSKKIIVENNEGNYNCTFVISATWSDGNDSGDAEITFTVFDVTDLMPQTYNNL